jgi:DNA-binding HxlR family transcriptional regulator
MQPTRLFAMERTSFRRAPCSIARSLDVLGDWWTPLLVRECLYGVRRFDEMQRWLGIGRNILTRRLALLVDRGLVEKRRYQDRPPRFEYHLTAKGYDAALLLVAMMPFGEEWYFGRGNEPVRLFDRETGRRVRPVLIDAATGQAIDARRLYAGPGPAFPKVEGVRRERFREYYLRRGRSSRPPGRVERPLGTRAAAAARGRRRAAPNG